jgi:hypothetical protein
VNSYFNVSISFEILQPKVDHKRPCISGAIEARELRGFIKEVLEFSH